MFDTFLPMGAFGSAEIEPKNYFLYEKYFSVCLVRHKK